MPDPKSASASGQTASPPPLTQVTAQQVIEMFADLGLPVCDDATEIKRKFDAKRDYYLKLLRDPNPNVRSKAEAGVKNGEALLNRRADLLRVVQEHFAGLANTALAGALAAGVTTLTPKLEQELRGIARSACRVDDRLADRFLQEFMEDEGLERDKPIVQPNLVDNFTATSVRGDVVLTWVLPASKCDEIEIVREPGSTAPTKKGGHRSLKIHPRKGETSVRDTDLLAGTWYSYAAYSIYQGVTSTDAPPPARAVCIGEVHDAGAVWDAGRMYLRWKLPGEDTAVVIFKRKDRPPSVRSGPRGPEVADGLTAQVHRGSGTSWFDPEVDEGVTYHYRIVADFKAGLFSDGINVQATVPKAPPAVATVTATYKRTVDRDVAVVEWPALPSNTPVEYLVVRRPGSAPAGRVEEGTLIQTTQQNLVLDEDIVSGQRYTYSVFTRSGELLSRTGTSTSPVDILTDVANPVAKTASKTVELAWTTPPNVSAVIVRRSLSEPRDHTDGTLVALSGAGHAKDDDRLKNGQQYHYLICCGYRPEGAGEVFSPGVRIAAVPERLPDPVTDFAVQALATEVVCTWKPLSTYALDDQEQEQDRDDELPKRRHVVVLRSRKPLSVVEGDRMEAANVDALGERVVATGDGRAVDSHPDIQKPYYTAFTIAGSHAVAGGAGVGAVCPDVTDLSLSAVKDGVILRWAWPPGCTNVRVARRADGWPDGPDDASATVFPCSRAEYMNTGNKFVDTVGEARARFHYVVYAQPSGAPGLFFARGTTSGCRAVIQWELWMTLRYHLSTSDANNGDILLEWNLENPFPDFSGFALIASQHRIPSALDDGVEIFRWRPGTGETSGIHAVSLEPIRKRQWARFFCKGMVQDPTQRHRTLIVHPDASAAISDDGSMQRARIDGPARPSAPGIPKTVICPECFDEFPVGRMLFTSFNGGEPVSGQYGWLERVRGRPPRPPTDGQGQRLTRKLCPRRHVLPFTAGAQPSIVLGLIGAKYSGKSHYIASLVKRLEGQVGSDLQAALLPVSDETQERYQREFQQPLFGNGLELPVTVGTPPPLIYDLTIDGGVWGESRTRAVTLALYDTAGENLDSQATVEQMLKYLRVASGVLFLVDPLQAPAVRDALPATVGLPNLDQMAEPNVILSRVLQLIDAGKAESGSGPLSIPVAVVLTKCDVLRDAGLIEANRLWNTDTRHVGYFDRAAHDDMTGMMAEYIQRWSPAAYMNVKQRFSRHAFFGVSATGCAPDTVTRRYKYISPWRVEDPLLWQLAELGIIPSR